MTLPPFARRLFHLAGVDRPVAYAIIGRMMSLVTLPLTAFFIVNRLSPAEQGYYYTFGNLIGLTIFFELGLNTVVTQFASHEKASLEWNAAGSLEGSRVAMQRLASLVRKTLKWYGIVALLVVVVVLPLGIGFFRGVAAKGPAVSWLTPWVWVVIASALWCWVSPIFAVFSGCGLIAEMQLNSLIQQAGYAILLWVVLALHGGLYATPVASTFVAAYAVVWAVTRKGTLLRDLRRTESGDHPIDWRREIWPMQWRIAVSWCSGYLMTQLFNPILFRYHGPEAAGKMGLTLSLCLALTATSLAWVSTKAPAFGMLIAQRRFAELDRAFFRSLLQSTGVILASATGLWLVLLWLWYVDHPYSRRLLSPGLTGVLFINAAALHVTNAMVVYLRAHKQEPLLKVNVVGGVVMLLSNYFLGRYFGAAGMIAAYLTCTLVIQLGWGTVLFLAKRKEWHAPPSAGLTTDAPVATVLSARS